MRDLVTKILLLRETRPFHPLSVNYLLFGKPNLSNDENTLLFLAVHRYIKYREVCIDNYTQRCIRYESRMVVRNLYSIAAPFLSFPCLFFLQSFFFFVCGRHFCDIYTFVHAQRATSGLHADALQKFDRH